jgi:aryl-alcohol dehydrogenase-like predicted oxidoreductase
MEHRTLGRTGVSVSKLCLGAMMFGAWGNPDHDESIRIVHAALTDLVHQGKVRSIGSSTFPAAQIVEAQWAARDRRLQRFQCEQPPYSILVRGIESDVLPTCAADRLPARYDMPDPANQRKLDAADALGRLADEVGMPLIQLAIAFVLNHPAVTAPIIGPRTMEHLESQLPAADVVLDEDVLDRIDAIVPPGTTINPAADGGWRNPALEPAARRRR